ncbi:Prospero homeobox protein 1 Homeobox prospero-like protein PROX1 [Triplophysa tibetana]|uniref:Prospero homeobox protein 1 Homeobox prospero-like protein PROX1 n=1 Tax=Triplophysa tibetana TaxID=1572043 RepID=A0A5A9PLN2_9TELE|nr:Prospero homeobox protein 1 Homeobox prospero-like protein PROX1 [Triplophysa tibetana]
MDTPSDRFHQQPSQMCPFELYRNLPDSNPTSHRFSPGSLASHPLFGPHMHLSNASQRWGNFRQRQGLFPGLLVDDDVGEEDVFAKREFSVGATPSPQCCPGDRGQDSAREPEDWNQNFARVKRLRINSALRNEEEVGRKGKKGRKNGASVKIDERKGAEQGNRRESREGRKRQRQELKLQLEETRGKLLELQRKVWRVYGGQRIEKKGGEEEQEDEALNLDEVADMFSNDDEALISAGFSPQRCSSKKNNESNQNGNPGIIPEETSMDLDLELNGDQVWLGCSLVRGEWESTEGGQKFAQALKQELASVVAQVIDRVVRLYAETDPSSVTPATVSMETGVAIDLNSERRQRSDTVACVVEQVEALPLITKSPQDKRAPIAQSGQKDLLLPQSNPSLAPLPQPPLSALFPPRSKDHFLPSYSPDNSVPLPLLHYTMQNLFARSLSSLPLNKDCLSEPFMDFRSHNSVFPPLPLLGQLDPSLLDRARDGGMRGGGATVDGADAALYLAAGSSQEGLSPCHLKKAKLMFFYSRYPSSSTLKTFFPDVKFNRCVTSQLIKWFSNFREFFYIQMERFARQAAREGLASARERAVRLGRDSELYRILNMHYNKSNDYQVPERFVEVSEIALREFYSAIQSGRDADPCWKKAIYKIISKLDSPVPDSFRLPGCPTDTYRMG